MPDSQNFPTLDHRIAHEAISFDLDSSGFGDAVDRWMATAGPEVEVLGIGEPMHLGEESLVLRNRLFRRLVERHGFSAIAIESSWPRGRIVDAFVQGRRGGTVEEAMAEGITHGMGTLTANRELVEWMKEWNASGKAAVRFYGCDAPTEMSGCDSPRRALNRVLDFLGSVDAASAGARRERIEALLGSDAAWENSAAMMDPSKGLGLSAEAHALRVETEELIAELEVRRPELVGAGGREEFAEALQFGRLARNMLAYHAGIARVSETRIADLLGLRDVMMADAVEYIAARERGRGRVLAFAHNSHLKKGRMRWELGWATGPRSVEWWPAGAHLRERMGARYAVIGVGVGRSEAFGLGAPEAGTIEARMLAAPGPWRIVPVGGVSGEGIAARGKAAGNPTYFGFSGASVGEYDWVCVGDSCGRSRAIS